jgi:hypothetical protein
MIFKLFILYKTAVEEVLEQMHDSVVKPLNIRQNLLLQKINQTDVLKILAFKTPIKLSTVLGHFIIPSPTKLRRDVETLPSFRSILVNTVKSTSFNGF